MNLLLNNRRTRIISPQNVANSINRFVATKNCYLYDTTSTFGSLSGSTKWVGGVLAPNGCIYGITFPTTTTTVLKIDPTTDTATTFGSLGSSGKWFGGVLAPNGMIYGIPYTSVTILKIGTYSNAENWMLSTQYNKF